MSYRAVKSYDSNDVIAIGYDENQAGNDYNEIGVWCDFIFDKIPEIPEELSSFIQQNQKSYNIYKIEDNSIVVKSLSELTK